VGIVAIAAPIMRVSRHMERVLFLIVEVRLCLLSSEACHGSEIVDSSVMGRWATLLAVLAGLALASPSWALGGRALVGGDPPLARPCQDSFLADTVVLCDPSARMRAASLTIGGLAVRLVGVAFPLGLPNYSTSPHDVRISGSYIEAGEPVLPGERLVARWRRAGPGAVLAARVADPFRRSRAVAFTLDPGTRFAVLEVRPDGSISFINGTRVLTNAVPPLSVGDPGGPPAPWAASSPQAAAQGFIDHLDLDARDDLAWLCAAIDPRVRPLLGDAGPLTASLEGIPAAGVGSPEPLRGCPLLELALFGDENVPLVVGSAGSVGSVRSIGPGRAVVTATVSHHFAPSVSDPGPPGGTVTVTAPVLVVLSSDGFWHVSIPGTLLPLSALGGGAALRSDAQLTYWQARALHAAGGQLRALRRRLAEITASTVAVGSHPRCGAGLRSTVTDPANDVRIADAQSTESKTRDPQLATVDVRRATLVAGHGQLCLKLTFARAAPPIAEVELALTQRNRSATVRFAVGRARAYAQRDPQRPRPLGRLLANRKGRSISLRIPLTALRGLNVRRPVSWVLSVIGPHPYAAGFVDEAAPARPVTLLR